jgi:hypothetical protein
MAARPRGPDTRIILSGMDRGKPEITMEVPEPAPRGVQRKPVPGTDAGVRLMSVAPNSVVAVSGVVVDLLRVAGIFGRCTGPSTLGARPARIALMLGAIV